MVLKNTQVWPVLWSLLVQKSPFEYYKGNLTQCTKAITSNKRYIIKQGYTTHCLLHKPPGLVSFLPLNHTMIWVFSLFCWCFRWDLIVRNQANISCHCPTAIPNSTWICPAQNRPESVQIASSVHVELPLLSSHTQSNPHSHHGGQSLRVTHTVILSSLFFPCPWRTCWSC